MIELLKKYGMVALAVALSVWAITVVPVLAGSDEWLQGAVSIGFGLLILGGLTAMHRGLRGGRAAVAVGALLTGLLVVWLVIPAIAAVAIVIWLLATRDLEQVPPHPV
jgi:hypothetical protein